MMNRRRRPEPLSARQWIVRTGGAVALGLAIGVVSRIVRPMLRGSVHYEALASLGLLIALSLLAAALHRRVPLRQALVALNAQVALLWGAFVAGWSIIHGGLWEDLAQVVFAWWLGVAVVSTLILAGVRWRWPLRVGPYCPQCGYHLVGLTTRRCPECGRTFTLQELDVREEELQLPTAESFHE